MKMPVSEYKTPSLDRFHSHFTGNKFYMKFYTKLYHATFTIQWNLVIKRSDITKPSYNKVILLVPALYISLFFHPDIMRNLI